MSVSEAQRRALHDGLVKKLGADVADTLMDYLPPAGWSDLARKSDLDALESRLNVKFAEMSTEFAVVRTEMASKFAAQTRWFVTTQLVLVVATIGSITTVATVGH